MKTPPTLQVALFERTKASRGLTQTPWRRVRSERPFVSDGASSRDRTGDLILTMDALYLLSYRGVLQKPMKYITKN